VTAVTEAEWLACCERATDMLTYLRRRAGKRKLRLFGCACCRRIWDSLVDERSRNAVIVAERFADELATLGELNAAKIAADEAQKNSVGMVDYHACAACAHVVHLQAGEAKNADYHAVRAAGPYLTGGQPYLPDELHSAHRTFDIHVFNTPRPKNEREAQCRIIRDLFGNPFRPLPPKKGKRAWEEQKRAWLVWNEGAVGKLAQGIYEDRAFDHMPILADALEEAGCANEDILTHCRDPRQVHVRGCWVIDLLLGKA
jgi:hypothetical protein